MNTDEKIYRLYFNLVPTMSLLFIVSSQFDDTRYMLRQYMYDMFIAFVHFPSVSQISMYGFIVLNFIHLRI